MFEYNNRLSRRTGKINRKKEVSDSIKAETLGGRHEVRPLQENDRTYDEKVLQEHYKGKLDDEESLGKINRVQYVGNRGKYIEKTKTEAGTRVLPMSDEVYAAFKRVVQNRKKPKVEEMIDGYTGFLFLDKRGKPMMPYQWEKRFQHVVECNFQR